MIRPGDLLHGDCNGVTTIPLDIASDVADACEEFMRCEAVILKYARGGNVTVDGLAQATAEFRRMIEALHKRVALKPQKTISTGPAAVSDKKTETLRKAFRFFEE